MVAGVGEKHADVRWVDEQDWFVHEGVFGPPWLSVVDDSVFAVRDQELRASDWAGVLRAGARAAPSMNGHWRPGETWDVHRRDSSSTTRRVCC